MYSYFCKSKGEKLHINIFGLIGVGKTTLTKGFEDQRCLVFYEKAEDFPSLKEFYEDPKKHAFKTQIQFLTKRLEIYNEAQSKNGHSDNVFVYDRYILEDIVFAKANLKEGNMTPEDFQTYKNLYDALIKNVKIPQVMIHLRAEPEVCLERIKQRDRLAEKGGISISYLKNLQDCYDEFIKEYLNKTMVVIVNWNEFTDVSELIDKINCRFPQNEKLTKKIGMIRIN